MSWDPYLFWGGWAHRSRACISLAWDPSGVGGPRVLELCSYCIGYGINPIPYMLCQVLIHIY